MGLGNGLDPKDFSCGFVQDLKIPAIIQILYEIWYVLKSPKVGKPKEYLRSICI